MQDPSDWKLTSPGGVKHKLIRQWGEFGREDASWNMEICIQSHDLSVFIVECFPPPVVVGPIVAYPRRFYPAGLPSLECKRVTVEGFTSGKPIDPYSAGVSLYPPDQYSRTYEPYLRVKIGFGTSPANDQAADSSNPFTFLEISASASGEFLTHEINQDDVEWEDEDGDTEAPDEKDTDLHQIVVATEVEWTCVWPQIPFVFFHTVLKQRMHAAMGKVNDDVLPLFGNAPAETILFLGYQKKYEYTWRKGNTGVSPVQVTVRFIEKNFEGKQKLSAESGESSQSGPTSWQDVWVTHNHIWRSNHGWQRLLVDGKPNYEQHDLMSIFLG